MTPRDARPGRITAAELTEQLANDQEYQEAEAAREAERQAKAAEWRVAERPIVDDLLAAGVEVDSVWDLVNTAEPYPDALPVLMEHLERGGYPDRVTEGIARSLAVKPANEYWERLRQLYLRAEGPDASEGLAVALAAAAKPDNLDDLIALLTADPPMAQVRGDTRIHFIRPILRVGGSRGREAVEGLRNDPVFGTEATARLARRK